MSSRVKLIVAKHLPILFGNEHGAEDLAVVLAVVDYRRPNLSRQPSLDYLSFLAGMQPGAFKQRLDALEKRGLISVGGNTEELKIGLDGLLREILEQTKQTTS